MGNRFFVYILSGPRAHRPVLYTSFTSDLARRLSEHRLCPFGFVLRYNLTRLVYFESTSSVYEAIAREKQIKAWARAKKIALVERANPYWRDLAP
jgi:putative endonuclease